MSDSEKTKLFNAFITPNLRLVQKVVSDHTNNVSNIDDNVQDTLINILKYMNSFDPEKGEKEIRNWIMTVSRRSAVSIEAKRVKDFRTFNEYCKLFKNQSSDFEEMEALDNDKNVDKILEIISTMDTLPESQKRAFYQRHFLGMSVLDISDELGLNYMGAALKVHAAKKKIIQEIKNK